jgi:hypothetical protein
MSEMIAKFLQIIKVLLELAVVVCLVQFALGLLSLGKTKSRSEPYSPQVLVACRPVLGRSQTAGRPATRP